MQLTKRAEYGLRTMIRLAVAHQLGREVISVKEIAESENLPVKFIEQILLQLRTAGYIETRRGKHGGYRVAIDPNEIRMGSIVRLIDGRLAPIACASETCYERCSCPDEETCGLRMLMIDVRNSIANILDRYTLSDVVSVTLSKSKKMGQVDPLGITDRPNLEHHHSRRERNADPKDGFLALLNENIE